MRWVRSLGSDVWENNYYPNGRSRFPYDVELPSGFVALYSSYRDDVLLAVNASDVFIKLDMYKNLKGGTLQFWAELIDRSLTEGRAFTVVSNRKVTLDDGTELQIISAVKTIGGKKYCYMVALAVADHWYWLNDRVILYQAWGPEAGFDKVKEKIEQSVKTMDL